MNKRIFFIASWISFLLLIIGTSACRYLIHLEKDHPPVVAEAEIRSIYIDNFKNILLNDQDEEELLQWVKNNDFNALSLYMSDILDCSDTNPIKIRLANFIKMAKMTYGIVEIIGVESTSKWFYTEDKNLSYLSMFTYNLNHIDLNERIDVFQLEDEWRNNNPSHNFKQFMNSLIPIFNASKMLSPIVKTEVYVGNFGWWRPGHRAKNILQNSDRIVLVNYRNEPSFSYALNDLKTIAIAAQGLNKISNVIILFSSLEDHCGLYFQSHRFEEAYQLFKEQYEMMRMEKQIPDVVEKFVKIRGYQIFTYSSAKKLR